YGSDGLDELTTTGPSTVVEWVASPLRATPGGTTGPRGSGTTTTSVIDPSELGLPRARGADLVGGDAETNARMARAILDGEHGPQRDIVVLNAAAGLVAGGVVNRLVEGLTVAADVIDDGRALDALQRLVAVSNAVIDCR
ncbi:MAG: hypothetical protein M3137_00670, partial [Actinomycetota bacterium]|nr:hypothetical protein [Actinomycetota bacterium]